MFQAKRKASGNLKAEQGKEILILQSEALYRKT